MFKLPDTKRTTELIMKTKSDSGISGPELAKAHMDLGMLLAEHMDIDADDTTVVAVMRGGLFFAEGMYFQLGCKFMTYDPKKEVFKRPKTKNVIIVDSVINSGKTIRKIADDNMLIACCVINEKAVPHFDRQLYTARVSENSYVGAEVREQKGAVGPDTTMRLFNQL